jgi:gamma-butyrobetaine dioxygenase
MPESETAELRLAFRERGYCLTRLKQGCDPEHELRELVQELFEVNRMKLTEIGVEREPRAQAFTTQPMTLHTDNVYLEDPARVLVMACIKPDESGGATILRDWRQVDLEADLLRRLKDPRWRWIGPGGDIGPARPVISSDGSIRWWRRSLTGMSEGDSLVADRLERALNDLAATVEIRLTRNDVLLIDNRRVLHGRRAIANVRRRYLRLWAW